MNVVLLTGRLTDVPEIRTSQGGTKIASYTLAVDRRGNGADFIRCKAFDKGAEFAEKWLRKGLKINVEGRIQTGSYKDKEGRTVYTTDVIVHSHEFCESKKTDGGFMPMDEEAPFT